MYSEAYADAGSRLGFSERRRYLAELYEYNRLKAYGLAYCLIKPLPKYPACNLFPLTFAPAK